MRALTLALVLLFGAVASAQEKKTVENPRFALWAKSKVGASTTLRLTQELKAVKTVVTTTTKLVEVKADELTVEVTTETEVKGQRTPGGPATKQTVKKTLELPADTPVPMGLKPEGTTEEGTETLKVGNTEITTKWYKYKVKISTGEIDGQVWMSEDVPGMMVKAASKGELGGDKLTNTMELIEFKK